MYYYRKNFSYLFNENLMWIRFVMCKKYGPQIDEEDTA